MTTVRARRRALEPRFPDAVVIGEVTNFAGEWTNGDDRYHGVIRLPSSATRAAQRSFADVINNGPQHLKEYLSVN
jgi:hypothetical protein